MKEERLRYFVDKYKDLLGDDEELNQEITRVLEEDHGIIFDYIGEYLTEKDENMVGLVASVIMHQILGTLITEV